MTFKKFLVPLILIFAFVIQPSSILADFDSAAADLKKANELIEQAITFAQQGDAKTAAQTFDTFNTNWFNIESGIKEHSQTAYQEIEEAMGQIQFIMFQNPIDETKLLSALQQLEQTNEKFINGGYPQETSDSSSNQGSVASLVALLDQSLDHIQNNEVQAAADNIQQFRQQWLNIEGVVLTQSSKVYSDAERDMVTAYALLASDPPRLQEAEQTIQTMRDYLAPLSGKTSYTLLDATTILLREGLEALLVVIALLGFLKKSGHGDKKRWIWYGVSGGILVSVILGVIVKLLFSAGAFGGNNFLIMGCTGLFAAVMLLYMSYWLHSKSSLHVWQQYIRTQSTKALATGSLFSLAALSFLAIFREGTETVIFFIGMASSISLANLLGGIALGLVLLVVISYLILTVGLKIPMRPFFLVSSIFVFYLCFKFTGMGIHGLQLAGLLPATHSSLLPSIDFLAVYQTWESFIPQLILLVAAVIAALWNIRKDAIVRKELQGQRSPV